MPVALWSLFRLSLPLTTLACLASYNPDSVTTTTVTTTTTAGDTTTTTTINCPCMLPSTDTTAQCRPPLFGPSAGTPTFTIMATMDANMCSAAMMGCSRYRIVTNGRCNAAVQTFPTTTPLPLICMGGPFFLGPTNPVEGVTCEAV